MIVEEQKSATDSFASPSENIYILSPPPQQSDTVSGLPTVSPNVLVSLRNKPSNEEIKKFIQILPHFESVFPDALMMHVMRRSGVTNPSEVAARCLGIAAQKFASDVINDARVLTELREEAKGGISNRESFVLTQDIIKEVLTHRGVFVDSFH